MPFRWLEAYITAILDARREDFMALSRRWLNKKGQGERNYLLAIVRRELKSGV
jgi:hypothetical protein